MKSAIKKALLRAAISFTIICIIVTALQYIGISRPEIVLAWAGSRSASGDLIISKEEVIHGLGLDVPWFLYLWPYYRPKDRYWKP
jgi:hypothetical protein